MSRKKETIIASLVGIMIMKIMKNKTTLYKRSQSFGHSREHINKMIAAMQSREIIRVALCV